MEQTWKLRPNLKWHDGQPLTADDFVFTWETLADPTLPKTLPAGFNLITAATAPDPQTLVLVFRSTTPLAGKAIYDPVPRHLVGTLVAAGDPDRNNLLLFVDGRMSWMEFQNRPEFAEPAAARDPRVRRAFYHTIDKLAVTELETAGLGIPADSPIRPDDPRRPQFANAIPDWTHDLTLAQRILADAGWQRGADGILVHSATGQRMETELRVTNTVAHVNAMAVMAENWRKIGAQVTETVIPGALSADGRYRSTYGFAGLSSGGNFSGLDGGVLGGTEISFSCATVARPETNWTPPGNRQGYCNPATDGLINRLQTTIPMVDRTPIQVELTRLLYREDYAQLPLFWLVVPLPFARGITGPAPVRTSWTAWNIRLWDKGG